MYRHHLLFCFAVLTFLLPSSSSAEWYQEQQDVMGTVISVEIWHADFAVAQQCKRQVFDEMHRIDALMSPYKTGSELYRLNKWAADYPVRVGDELFSLIERAQQISELSDGAFDITFASVGHMYNYRRQIHPSEEEIKAKLAAIDYHHIILNPENRTVHFSRPGVTIDLGGIAKGYAVDNSIEILARCGATNALVSAGGDSRILGDKGGRPWMMGIQHPRKREEVALVLPLSDTAISTSGDYERYFIDKGERHHHIISPRSGKSISTTISATVIGPDATTTDALSTTIFVLGSTGGVELVETLPGFDAIIIDSRGQVHYSSGLQPPSNSEEAQETKKD